MKRGLPYAEAMAYVGVKRRTFDEMWRPRLVALRQGACLLFDRQDLDRLFDEFKRQAAGELPPAAANDETPAPVSQNGPRNGRPIIKKGGPEWAERQPGSTPARRKEVGRSTSGTAALDFASVASAVLKKRKVG